MRIAKKTQQGRYYFHKDHLGSSTAMTDATGAKVETTEYVPYGEMREHQGTEVTNYKFTDQELDPETGLYNYGARLYDPVIGRFITPDTMILNIYDPQSLNRYSYCRNNPLIYTDPTGHGWGNDKGTGPGDSPCKGLGGDTTGSFGDKGGKGNTGGGGYNDKTPSEAKGAKGGFSIGQSSPSPAAEAMNFEKEREKQRVLDIDHIAPEIPECPPGTHFAFDEEKAKQLAEEYSNIVENAEPAIGLLGILGALKTLGEYFAKEPPSPFSMVAAAAFLSYKFAEGPGAAISAVAQSCGCMPDEGRYRDWQNRGGEDKGDYNGDHEIW